MLDAHADALDELHKKLTDKMASRIGAKHGKKPAHVVAVMSKQEEPEPEAEPDGDEAEGEEEKPASPGASAALKLLAAIRGKR